MNFVHGQIVEQNGLGNQLVVAAYQQGSDIAVEWGGLSPLQATPGHFVVQWSLNGGPTNSRNVPNGFATTGLWFVPMPVAGTYSIAVSTVSSPPVVLPAVSVTFVPPSPPSQCPTDSQGPIGDRWRALGGAFGPLGCPKNAQYPVTDPTTGAGGTAQDFDHGEMVLSPAQGPNLVVSLYQSLDQLYVDWSTSSPYAYDKFIVRWVQTGFQFDYALTNGNKFSTGNTSLDEFEDPPFSNPPHYDVGTNYSIEIEGCDVGSFNGSSCNQSWTIPVSFTFQQPTSPGAQPTFLDLTGLTPVSSVDHVYDEFAQRTQAALSYIACNTDLGNATGNELTWANGALTKLGMVSRGVPSCAGRTIDYRTEVNQSILGQVIGSKVGTSAPFPCLRTGEYDVLLSAYVRLVEQFSPLLDDAARQHIVNDLLNQKGSIDPSEFSFDCDTFSVPETENHLNQIESARYLTNQILYEQTGDPAYDNEANGMNLYWLQRLQGFAQNDFWEYQARTSYQLYTDDAILNLFDFAKDRRIRMGARVVLDYIAAKFAASSNYLRRDAPYRRHVSDYDPAILLNHIDEQTARFMSLAGNFQIFDDPGYATSLVPGDQFGASMFMAGLSSYRVPDTILEFLVDAPHRSFYQRFKHYTVETYSSRPDYLISAGGFWTPAQKEINIGSSDCIGCDDRGRSVPITLMPSDEFISSDSMIRFDSTGTDDVYTCVAPDFACGVNLVVPGFYTDPSKQGACWQTVGANGGNWTFINFSDPNCKDVSFGTFHYPGSLTPYGFYVATWKVDGQIAEGPTFSANNYGFFEVHPADPNVSFAQFIGNVITGNSGVTFTAAGPNRYVMTSGAVLEFSIPSGQTVNQLAWPISEMGDPTLDALGTDASTWPLASGDILNSDGHNGLIDFHNPTTQGGVSINFTDVAEPYERFFADPGLLTGTQRIMSMAVPGDWFVTNGSGRASPLSADGYGSLAVTGDPFVAISSAPMSSAEIRAASGDDLTSVGYELRIPDDATSRRRIGGTRTFISSRSAHLLFESVGEIDLNGQETGRFVNEQFSLPHQAIRALQEDHPDVRITIVLDVRRDSGPWLLSDLHFGAGDGSLPTYNSEHGRGNDRDRN